MTKSYPFPEIQEKLSGCQKLFLALPANPRYDQVAGALSLSLSLQQAGKTASVVCATPMTVEFHNLVGVDKISPKVKGTDLIVSFNYSMDEVEKISYNDDGGKLNLVIQPKNGAPAINEKAVNFSYAGVSADLVITIGIKNINQLDSLGLNLTNPEAMLNIDNRSDNTNFAAINIIDVDASSVSEIILGMIEGLGLPVAIDTAQNLLNGLWRATQGLKRVDLGPDAYEAVATCLRLGAQRAVEVQPQRPPESFHQKQKVWQQPKVESKVVEATGEQPKAPPADWFEPKIYRGTSNV